MHTLREIQSFAIMPLLELETNTFKRQNPKNKFSHFKRKSHDDVFDNFILNKIVTQILKSKRYNAI